jgi:hypothetical protein
MVDVEDVDDLLVVIDAIANSILATTSTILTLERGMEGRTDSVWIGGKRAEQELHTCGRD